ncbi:MAG: hypothetical protein NWP31_05765 [Solirubrobacteraceae bacterium]|jgi:hypothetical protein|nr:hypothetical protein [Solirubrobacteraceae bacterium]MDP4672359.1 hypothetical protein [Solirubrobacteraceae bacterium]MDP4921055.1 hypothetical protein [Solirubrobacteraceae bacterium]MDP5034433.1 hypothetical protein [Solirubrobacteraceae bacterium]
MADRLESARDELRARAEKIDPGYTEGQLRVVASGRNQSEAELIANLLLEEGIPSVTRRSRGSDVPDMLAAGRRDLLVAESALPAARDVLLESEIIDDGDQYRPSPLKLFSGLLAAVAVVGAVIAVGLLIGA